MPRIRCLLTLLVLFLSVCAVESQEKKDAPTPHTSATQVKDVDPLALRVLNAVADPVEHAQAFSFKALISEEEEASNGQTLTFFHSVDVTVQRPDKIHLIFHGRGERVEFFTANGTTTRYAPEPKLYSSFPAQGTTIDEMISNLHKRNIEMAIGPFLRTDFYDLAANSATTGYVIGRVKIYDQDVHQIAFTAPDADWQMWVTGGEQPRIIRVEVINKKLEGKPRTTIQFLDWTLNPTLSSDEFTFIKPDDAHQIDSLSEAGGRTK